MFVATAFPPNRVTVSRRSRYSEQPPSTERRAPSASARSASLNGRIGAPIRQVKHVSSKRLVASIGEASGGGRESAGLFARDLGLSQQEKVEVIWRQRVIGRRFDLIARAGLAHELWC